VIRRRNVRYGGAVCDVPGRSRQREALVMKWTEVLAYALAALIFAVAVFEVLK